VLSGTVGPLAPARGGGLAERLRRDAPLAASDLGVAFFSYLLTLALRFDGSVPDRYWSSFWRFLPVALAIHLLVHRLCGLYDPMWRYASVQEARRIVLAGALVGFLAWNLPPARVFLGNGGAYGLGSLLTVLAAQATVLHGYHGLLAAGLCLGVFAFELSFTVVRRLVSSQRLATGDRRHSYDLLGRSRGNRDRSTLALWTLGAVSAGAGYAADQVSLAAAGTTIAVAFVMGTAAGGRLWRQATSGQEEQAVQTAPRPRERG
jgi:hypothetical protein